MRQHGRTLAIVQTRQHLKYAWPTIQQQLMEGAYRPQNNLNFVNGAHLPVNSRCSTLNRTRLFYAGFGRAMALRGL